MRTVSGRTSAAARLLAVLLLGLCAGLASARAEPVVQSYLYLEPFNARVEVLLDLPTMLVRLGQARDAAQPLTPQDQAAIGLAAGGLAKEWCRVKTDGENVNGSLTAVAFVKGEPGNTMPMKPDETAAPKDLMIGLVWEFGIGGDPKHLEVFWSGFADPVDRMPMTVFVGNSTEQLEFTKSVPMARWNNDGKHMPRPKPLAEVPKLPVPQVYAVPVAMLVWLLAGVAIYIWMEVKRFKFPGGFLPFLAAWGVGLVISYNLGVVLINDPFGQKADPVTKPEQAEKVLLPLLKNVYRAFDYHKESEVYDRLERSVTGELLRTLYLQTIQALTLEGQEGTRARVSDLVVNVDKVTPQSTGFVAETEWTALGTVGHWGHQHQRVNRYKARLTVVPDKEEWKIKGMEVEEERRL